MKPHRSVVLAASFIAPFLAAVPALSAQSTATFSLPAAEPSSVPLPIGEDRGSAKLEQDFKRLATTGRVMEIVAHPDDEDGSLLTYLSRGLGVRCVLFTLTRGEGGQNAMSAEVYDALGLMRTNELLKADEYYGAKQLWGSQADFGFSKTQEEAFSKWGHERVLYDAVLAVRRERPQIILSTFIGGITDGHGQHQVSGEIAQEVFKAAADPKVFPDQLKPVSEGGLGLTVWQVSAVYGMTPFAPITEKGMFDYATGKWAPAQFKNYVTGEVSKGEPTSDVTIEVGKLDADLGRNYTQIAREGWGMQKSQYGGANPTLSGPDETSYHLWAVLPENRATTSADKQSNDDLFENSKVNINRWFTGLNLLLGDHPAAWLQTGLFSIDAGMRAAIAKRNQVSRVEEAGLIAAPYRATLELRARLNNASGSEIDSPVRERLLFELDNKIADFQAVLADLLGLDMIPFRTREAKAEGRAFRGSSADETAPSVAPGETLYVRVHATQALAETKLARVWLQGDGAEWPNEIVSGTPDPAAAVADPVFRVTVPANASPTAPFFTRPTIEQPFYDISNPTLRGRSFAPWPLAAWAEFTFQGLPIRLGQVVETMHRVTGPGGIYEPLIVTPRIGVSISPDAQILPLDGGTLPVRVTVHAQSAAEGSVSLHLPEGWHAEPATATFKLASAGDTQPLVFRVTATGAQNGAFSIQAVATSEGKSYESGWRSIGYPGLRPYNQYLKAVLRTRKVDVKIAPGLHIGYVMGPGDLVPDALEAMGVHVQSLSDSDLRSANLSSFNAIVIGIRAYSVRPSLALVQPRLEEYVRGGGTLVVQYQSANFPAPLPLSLSGRVPERVVDETAAVRILEPANGLLSFPNRITPADFDGWIEERGHSFLSSWDTGYTALTETADPGQDPQRGGLLVTHPGKGTYIYIAYALYRQLPELVPGSYRILANLVSAGSNHQ